MKITTAICMIVTTLLAQARFVHLWTYQELFDQADLVVIAKPVATQDTSEQAVLIGSAAVGLSTDFAISAVMKGEKSIKKVVLHHYRSTDIKEVSIDGPNLCSFDSKASERFLLFLRRDSDGRYSPVSGQVDPVFSIAKIDGAAGVVESFDFTLKPTPSGTK